MKKLQIGIIGSMADQKISTVNIKIAGQVGEEVAKAGAILIFGYEEDFESISQIAAKAAIEKGGETICFVAGTSKPKKINSVAIVTGQNKGGGREFSLVLSADAIISIAGGSGTLGEIAMAYQANIPTIAIENTGGWSDKLQNNFLDERKRIKITPAKNAKEAVAKAIKLASKL